MKRRSRHVHFLDHEESWPGALTPDQHERLRVYSPDRGAKHGKWPRWRIMGSRFGPIPLPFTHRRTRWR